MLPPIHFNHQPKLLAVEICYVRTNRVLSPKLGSTALARSQAPP
jgi:hypothetical protein